MLSAKDQMDGSLTNLFDSLNKPLIHENKFDLTQKINDNFKDILSQSRYDNYNQHMYANDYAQQEDDLNAPPPQFRSVLPPPVTAEPPALEDEDKGSKILQSMTPSFQMRHEDNPYQQNQYVNDYQLLITQQQKGKLNNKFKDFQPGQQKQGELFSKDSAQGSLPGQASAISSPLYPQSHSSAGVFQKNSGVSVQPQYLNPTQS